MKKIMLLCTLLYVPNAFGMATGLDFPNNGEVNLLPTPEDGDLDVEFGIFNFNAGTITTDFGFFSSNEANGVAIQTDGGIVAAGSAFNSNQTGPTSFAVARFFTNGTLDRTFYQSGSVQTPGQVITNFGGTDDQCTAVNIQPNGIIVAGGFTNVSNRYQFALAFYQKDGQTVPFFGTNGLIITPSFSVNSNDQARALALEFNGRIILAGTTVDANGQAFIAVARYNSDGTLDSTFGTGGQVIVPSLSTGSQDRGFAVALDQANRIVVGGTSRDVFGNTAFAVVRLTTTGALDITFNPLAIGSPAGTVLQQFDASSNILSSLLVQPDGLILTGGTTNQGGIGTDFAFARFLDNGSLDPNFNQQGTLVIPLTNTENILTSMALQSDGKIIACGSNGIEDVNKKFLVARFTANGTLDTLSFNPLSIPNVFNFPTFNNADPFAVNPFIIPDFNILPLIDVNNFSTDEGFTISPLFDQSNPRAIAGFTITPIFGTDDQINAVALQQDGRIVAAGRARPLLSQGSVFALARYLDDTPLVPATILSPNNGQVIIATGLSGPAFVGTAQNPSNIALYYSGPTGVLLGTTTTIPGLNLWVISGVTGLAEGDNQVQAVANYRNGQVSMISDTIVVNAQTNG